MIAVGAYNPTVGVVLYLASFVMLGILNVIAFSLPILFAGLAIGIVFIWAIRA